MSQARLWAICAFGSFLLGGCGLIFSDPVAQLGPARETVIASLNAMGSLEAWRKVGQIRAKAVVTMYDEKGQAYVNRQDQVIGLSAGKIVARATTPQGAWKAQVVLDGPSELESPGFQLDPAIKNRILASLATELHRVGGPLNFILADERARSREPARVGGVDVVRVGVGADNRRAIAYYFDATTHLLRFLTSGADKAGHKGTVTVYTYMMLPGGMAFPRRIRVVEIGQHVLVGEKHVLDVDFSDVTLH